VPQKRRRRTQHVGPQTRSSPAMATPVASPASAIFPATAERTNATISQAPRPVAPARRQPDSRAAALAGRTGQFAVSVESLLWMLLIAAAAVSRFWDLGYRTLHHDESLHVYYSWKFMTGEIPYEHNPLMHGPFLFASNALVYFLFGESNYTSRMLPALVGVLLVAAPWMLRGGEFLGRWGALAAGFMLFISPAFLYYTRFIRHDPYTSLGSVILCIAIFHYLHQPRRRWMIVAFATVAILLANHEIIFAILLVFVAVLWGALLATRLRPLIPIHLVAAGAAMLILLARRVLDWASLPAIPWKSPSPEKTRHFYSELIQNPLIISVLLLGVGFVLACGLTLRRQARMRATEGGGGALEALFGNARPGSVSYGVLHALRDPEGLAIGAVVMLGIFFGLFTTFFTSPRGFQSSTFATNGTLLYWLGQQGERRGNQPWFYFITEGLQYEWLAIFLGVAGLILTGVLLVRHVLGNEASRAAARDPLFPVFLGSWLVFMFLVLSWAGEKMPWLITHITLPAFLLGGLVVNTVVEGASAWLRSRDAAAGARRMRPTLALAAALVAIAGSGFFLSSRMTYGRWNQLSENLWERTIPRTTLDDWWMLALPPLAALTLIGFAVLRMGARRAAYGTLIGALAVMTLFQVHAGFWMTYFNGDGANDTLIYNTVGSDVTQLSNDLNEMSQLIYGDASMPVIYDNCTAWPLNWNLRDLPNRRLQATVAATDQNPPPVVIGVPKAWDKDCSMPPEIEGYTIQQYTFRWHEPEAEIYRRFAIAPELAPGLSAWGSERSPHGPGAIIDSVWNSTAQLADPAGQQRLFRLLMFREMPAGVTRYRVNVYIRNDTLAYYNAVRYGE